MIAYRKEKIENAICFFALEHKKHTGKDLNQTSLYKYLAFLDFDSVKDTGQPALELNYKAMMNGPVPMDIYANKESIKSCCFHFQKREGDKWYVVTEKGAKADLDYFSDYEIEKMQRLITIFANKDVYASHMSESTHQNILAWKRAWREKQNGMIDFKLMFRGDINEKSEEELSDAEKHFLIYRAMESMSE